MGSFSLKFISACTLGFALALSAQPPAAPDAQAQVRQRLIGHPLYLRDAWQEDTLEFDGYGHPLRAAEAHRGPLTLSGIDISDVTIRGDQLRLQGKRVALVASGADHPLQRATAIRSTTELFFSLRRGDKRLYRATEDIQITIHANARGSFNEALDTIFADGLAQLAYSVPSFWRCYAASYFLATTPRADAAQAVERCAATQSTGVHYKGLEPDTYTPAAVLESAESRYTRAAGQLSLQGESDVYVTIEANGLPSEFQVIQPIGAGLDEETLLAASHFTFRAATLDGKPVRSGFLVQIRYGSQP